MGKPQLKEHTAGSAPQFFCFHRTSTCHQLRLRSRCFSAYYQRCPVGWLHAACCQLRQPTAHSKAQMTLGLGQAPAPDRWIKLKQPMRPALQLALIPPQHAALMPLLTQQT